MNKFRGGQKLQPTMSKQQVIDLYTTKVQEMANTLQQFQTWNMQQLAKLTQQVANLSQRLEAIDYRTVATRNLLIEKGVFTDAEHTAEARKLRIETFDIESAADDIRRKLLPVADDHAAVVGDVATLEITAEYAYTKKNADGIEEAVDPSKAGKPLEQFSALRSKIELGSGELMPELEVALVGAKVGETKEITITLPPAYQGFAGEHVTFKVNVIDLKAPLKVVEPAKTESAVDANAGN